VVVQGTTTLFSHFPKNSDTRHPERRRREGPFAALRATPALLYQIAARNESGLTIMSPA